MTSTTERARGAAPEIQPVPGVFSEQTERRILWGVRIALVLAIAFSVAFPNLPQFEGKGMAFRAPFYLLPLAVTPLIWKQRGARPRYPYLVDALVISPFLVDTLGNALNFYNNFEQTDDVLHFLNWVLLMAGVTLALARTGIGRLNAWTLAWGLGALAIIWWEAAEWVVQQLGTAGLGLTYEDTIGDLLLSSSGGAIGSALVIFFAWDRISPTPTASRLEQEMAPAPLRKGTSVV